MWVDQFLQNDLQKAKVKQASEEKEQHQLGELSLKELNQVQGLAQVGFGVPRVFHCSFRHTWNYRWTNGGNYLRKSLGKWEENKWECCIITAISCKNSILKSNESLECLLSVYSLLLTEIFMLATTEFIYPCSSSKSWK